MGYTIRVSLPGYNALTDTNIDHYALYTDSDNILIKEYARGLVTVSPNTTYSIQHNLGYAPSFMVLYNTNISNPYYTYCYGAGIYSYISIYSNNQFLYLVNKYLNVSVNFVYYIFYDNV